MYFISGCKGSVEIVLPREMLYILHTCYQSLIGHSPSGIHKKYIVNVIFPFVDELISNSYADSHLQNRLYAYLRAG